jgi:hypothetical protein
VQAELTRSLPSIQFSLQGGEGVRGPQNDTKSVIPAQ